MRYCARIGLLLGVLLCGTTLGDDEAVHEWVSHTGSKTKASLVPDKTVFVLRTPEGKELQVPASLLSEDSRQLAVKLLAQKLLAEAEAEIAKLKADLAEAQRAGASKPSGVKERPAGTAGYGGIVKFKDGSSRRFTKLAGVRMSISSSHTPLAGETVLVHYKPLDGKLVLDEFKDGMPVKQSEVPLEQTASVTVNPRGADGLAVTVATIDGKQETFAVSNFGIEVTWADSVASERIMVANHKDTAKYLGMTITFD